MIELVLGTLAAAWGVLTAMAPYLLLGFLVAGALSVMVTAERVERHLGGVRFIQVFKAALLGIPLPLCSCGVIPVAVSLHRHGASKGATTAFLLSTPQTGVDSISVTYALLGPFLALFRPLAALLTGFAGGAVVHLLERGSPETTGSEPAAIASGGSGHALADQACGSEDGECDCSTAGPACGPDCACDAAAAPGSGKLTRALRHGLVTLPRDIGKPLLVGILASGLISALIPPASLASYLGDGMLPILAAMAIGVPLYVCATASVPIAVGLIHAGLSPGAALAFLISGPATNGATLATLWKVLGRRTAVVYLSTVVVGAVASGMVVNSLISAADIPTSAFLGVAAGAAGHAHHGQASVLAEWIGNGSAVVLLVVLGAALRPRRRRLPEQHPAGVRKEGMPMVDLKIKGMHCQGCVQSVTRALSEVAGVTAVDVDLASGLARVAGRPSATDLRAAVVSLGFTVEQPTAPEGGQGAVAVTKA